MNILFTVCGRAGSKGFQNKNLKEMRGVPLVYYTLACIGIFIRMHPEHMIVIAVNTDSRELIQLIKAQHKLEDIVYVDRKPELSGDTVPKALVVQDTYVCVSRRGEQDLIIDLDITSPLRSVRDLENLIDRYCAHQEYDLVVSAVRSRRSPYFNMVEQRQDGCFGKICQSSYTARQQVPETFELNASMYAYRPRMLKEKLDRTILDYPCGISQMEDYLVLDIDSEEDFNRMQMLYPYYCKNDPKLEQIYEAARQMQDDAHMGGVYHQ